MTKVRVTKSQHRAMEIMALTYKRLVETGEMSAISKREFETKLLPMALVVNDFMKDFKLK